MLEKHCCSKTALGNSGASTIKKKKEKKRPQGCKKETERSHANDRRGDALRAHGKKEAEDDDDVDVMTQSERQERGPASSGGVRELCLRGL